MLFVTFTVVNWIDVFTRPVYKEIVVESLNHCTEKKGLTIFGWCLMTNHIHMIAKTEDGIAMWQVIRDFKRFTNREIIKAIQENPESRRDWLLDKFHFAAKYNNDVNDYKFWQEGYAPFEIYSAEMFEQKIDYIHNNPVKAGIVAEPYHYLYSSAIDYAGGKGLVNVILA